VAKWWIPEAFEFVEQIPRTAVGKYDKRQLRERYGGRDQSAA
jgi:acyl-CoA synthetase (AMP-forming)/AMP-acid ligase II